MLFYVLNEKELAIIFNQLGYPFSKKIIKKNYDYYMKRTSHGSTLSMVVHASIAEHLGHNKLFQQFFMEALKSDVQDTQGGTTPEGIHCGVMAGTIDLFLRGYAGLIVREDMLSLKPDLTGKIKNVEFRIRYKNVWYKFNISKKKITTTAEPLQAMFIQDVPGIPIEINGKVYKMKPWKLFTVTY